MPETPQKSVVDQYGGWDEAYRMLRPEELPWNAGGPDPDLVRCVESGAIPAGNAVDVGTGPGHDAVYLATKGFRVTAVDISPKAVELAKQTAEKAGVANAVDFKAANILTLPLSRGSAAFVNDRGCFHAIAPEDWKTYIRIVVDVLAPGGLFLLRTFSDKEPPAPGPRRFSRKELEDLFSPFFEFLEFKEGIFAGPRKPKAYICLLRKKT